MKKVTIEIPEGKEAKWVGNVLTLVDEQPKDITERIKTFEDACEWCNENGLSHLVHTHAAFYQEVHASVGGEYLIDVDAYLSLRIICAALNEGWEPKFTEDETRYYPYFYLYTQKEIDEMSEEQKQELWLFGGSSDLGSHCGLAYASSTYAWSASSSAFSARLALRTRELAIYAGKQFKEIWADYVFLKAEEDEE